MNPFRNSQEWLAKLISFDTTSRHSNLELIAEIQTFFEDQGLRYRLTKDSTGKKANLFATLSASDGQTQGGLVLSGHTDVVPVDGQAWDSNPFQATLRGEKIYGRGTSDMKGFIAVTLAMLPQFKQMKLKKPLHFAFSYDEEVGCHGAAVMIKDLLNAGIQPEGCIVGEPTELRPVVAHKGIHLFRCRVRGKAAHSSLTHQGCNAIEYAARLICFIRDWSQQIKSQGPFDTHFEVPFTTISTNCIEGGNAYNTIPASCEFFFEFRNLPTVASEEIIQPIKRHLEETILPLMREEDPDAAIELERIAGVPAFEASEKNWLTPFLRELRKDSKVHKVTYATEAGLFQNAKIPTILCGPGSIKQAHAANEYIEVSELVRCEELLQRVGEALAAS